MPPSLPSPEGTLPPLPDLPDLADLDVGIVTSGLCNTPEAQAAFDRDQAGKPPLDYPAA